MFRNLKVGTKLLAVALAPLLVLVVLAGLGIRERLDDARQAETVEAQARLAAADNTVVHQLQRERIYSAWLMASATAGAGQEELAAIRADLDAQRAETDAALAAAQPLISDTGGGDDAMAASQTATEGRLDDLAVVRQSVDANQVDAAVALDIYAQTIALVLDLNEGISDVTEDPSLSVPLQDSVTLARLTEAEGALSGIVTNVLVRGEATEAEIEQMQALVDDADDQDGNLQQSSDAETKTLVRNKQARADVSDAESLQDQILAVAADGGSLDAVTVDQWADASLRRLDAYQEIQDEVVGKVIAETGNQASSAQQAVRLYILGALAATLLAVLLAVIVGRATTGPLRQLTEAADRLSTERLPRLVEDLKAPGTSDQSVQMELEPIAIRSTDEIGQLAEAFNKMQEVTAEVAEEQSVLLRKGIGDIFVNLARRNQALLDRQIEFIDGLEADEEDPDQLEHLFKLDHLATRMRRNAESLLVLAGAEPPRRRARPVALADVVRVAVGEVEDFTRISLLTLDDVTVGGNVAVDLAHLLSELMENATHFSPPDTRVEVVGHRTRDAGYIISVSDQGIGMSAEQIADANQLLVEPPLVGLALSRSLGFIVIGRLAGRFGISVRLTSSPAGGVTALVGLPPDLVSETPEPEAAIAGAAAGTSPAPRSASLAPTGATPPPPPPPPAPGLAPPSPSPMPIGLDGAGLPTRDPGASYDLPPPAAPVSPMPAAPAPSTPSSLDDALPQGDAFEQGLASLLAPGGPDAGAPSSPPAPADLPDVPSGWGSDPSAAPQGGASPAPEAEGRSWMADDLFAPSSVPAPPNGNGHGAPTLPGVPLAGGIFPSGPAEGDLGAGPYGADPYGADPAPGGEAVPGDGFDPAGSPFASAPAFPDAAAPPAAPPVPPAPEWLPDDDFRAPVPGDDPLMGVSTRAAGPADVAPPAPPPAPPMGAVPPPPPPPPPNAGQDPQLPQWLADPAPAEDLGAPETRGTRLTPAGLVQRTPRATLANRDQEEGPAVAQTQRSPEEVRAMLSRYRSGLQRGRGPADNTSGDPADPPRTTDAPWEGQGR
jgi:signal transduction histidine kinase